MGGERRVGSSTRSCVTVVGPHLGGGRPQRRWLSRAELGLLVVLAVLAVARPAGAAADTVRSYRLRLVAGRHGCFAARASSRCLALPALRHEGSASNICGGFLRLFPIGSRSRGSSNCYEVPDVELAVSPDGRFVYLDTSIDRGGKHEDPG